METSSGSVLEAGVTRSWLPILVVVGCSRTDIALLIDRIDPNQSAVGTSPEVTIHGLFHPEPRVSYRPGGSSGADTTFSASLNEHALEDVRYMDRQQLTAVVPLGLEVGVYDLTVRDPRGENATLPAAFVVYQPNGADGETDRDGGDPSDGDPAVGDSNGGDPAVGDSNGGDPAVGDSNGGDPAVGDPNGGDPAVGDPNGGDGLPPCDTCTSGPCVVLCTADPCTTDCQRCDCDIQCAGVDACRADCTSSAACSMDCSDVADCRTDCSGSSSCDITCAGGSCRIDCWENATCSIDCTHAESCRLDCRDSAQCLLDYTGASSWSWDCDGSVTMCGGTVVACNRPCP
jgi:hypothetical protein